MSAIRPPVPSPLFPAQGPASPARAARSDFFRAALDGVKTGAPASTLVAAEKPDALVASIAPPPFEPSGDRPVRPGSLLDIRV
jgi:hypothetical protein